MPELPAICRSCGTVFGSSVVLENTRDTTFVGSTSGPCPNCEGIGEIPDGVYSVAGEVINVLALSQTSRDRIERIADILRDARARNADPEEVATAVERESPQLANVIRTLLIPRDAAAFYGLLAIVVMVILKFYPSPDATSPSDAQIEEITRAAVAAAIADTRANTQSEPAPSTATATPARPLRAAKKGSKRPKRPGKTYGRSKRQK
jgi:hypothetical protein